MNNNLIYIFTSFNSRVIKVMQHLQKNYVQTGARYPIELWSHHDSTMALMIRTTNACEAFHSLLNDQMLKNIQFFKIVSTIELYCIDVELTRARLREGRGLDSKTNNKRYRETIRAQRGMRAFLSLSEDFEERYRYLYKHHQVKACEDRDWVYRYNPDSVLE